VSGEQEKRPLRVLIVDDNQDGGESLAILVRWWGHDARTAYDGLSGWRLAQEYAPDCLILDARMPGMDGYEFASRAREDPALAQAKLIALSANSDAEHVRRVEAAGFDYRFTKPAPLDELEELLKMLDQLKELARQNVELAGETRELLQEVKEDIKEVKADVRELKEGLRELQEGRKEPDEKEGEPGQ
jgi:CheY-like chemotaxis protein